MDQLSEISDIELIENGKMELDEEVDINKLRIIRDNFTEVFMRMGNKTKVFNMETKKYEVCTDMKKALTVINDMYKHKLKTTKVMYKFSPRVTYGRRFSSLSLQGCPRPIRHTIAKDIYIDVDICNAHPTFLQYKCKEMKFDHPQLLHYITHRDECLQELINMSYYEYNNEKHPISRDIAKSCFLKIINGGGLTIEVQIDNNIKHIPLCNPPIWLCECKERQTELLDEFYKWNKYPSHQKYVQRSINNVEKDWNKKASALNYWLCDMENQVVTEMERYCIQHNIEYGTLCFDGIMLYKKSITTSTDILLRSIETELQKKCNMNITLSEKIMNEDIDLSGLSIIQDIKTSNVDYALYILDQLKDSIKYSPTHRKLYLYNSEETLWKIISIESLTSFFPEILEPYIITSPDPDEVKFQTELLHQTFVQKNILYQVKTRIELKNDDNFIREHFDTKKGVFPLAKNLVIDLKTLIVRSRVKEDYFTKTTDRTFIPDYNKEFVTIYYQEMLTDATTKQKPTEKHVQCLMSCMGYILTGENNLKKFINLLGNGDNGKSLFIKLHRMIMGDFACIGNKRTFIKQKNTSNHDSETISLINKRLVILSELSKKEEFNEEFLKAVTGSDAQSVRACGTNETIEVMFQFIPVIASNHICKFECDTFKKRLLCFNFCNKFENNPDREKELLGSLDQFFSNLCIYAHSYYSTNQKVQWSKEVDDYTEEMKNSHDIFLSWIKEQEVFEIGAIDDVVVKECIYNDFTEYSRNNKTSIIGKNTFYKRLEEYFALDKSVQLVVPDSSGFIKKQWCYKRLKSLL